MQRTRIERVLIAIVALAACGDSDGVGPSAGVGGEAGTSAGEADGSVGAGGTGGGSFEEIRDLVMAYGAAHPGADGDITAKTPAQLAADPDAAQLHALCGDDQLPVFPTLTWEYGGNDHAWINAEMSPLVICVYTPVVPSTDHWEYDATMDHVTADVYVLFPDDGPCKDETGADQVAKCIGDATNFEILVDTASLNDGTDVGLQLSEASTDLNLVLPDDTKVFLVHND